MRESWVNLNKELIKEILNMKFSFGIINYGITPMHIIWLVFMEIMYAKYPQRFWSGSNQTLQCAHCKDKTCQWKKAGSAAKQKEMG